MEMFSTLLAFCEENPLVTGGLPSLSSYVFFVFSPKRAGQNAHFGEQQRRLANDLRYHDTPMVSL